MPYKKRAVVLDCGCQRYVFCFDPTMHNRCAQDHGDNDASPAMSFEIELVDEDVVQQECARLFAKEREVREEMIMTSYFLGNVEVASLFVKARTIAVTPLFSFLSAAHVMKILGRWKNGSETGYVVHPRKMKNGPRRTGWKNG